MAIERFLLKVIVIGAWILATAGISYAGNHGAFVTALEEGDLEVAHAIVRDIPEVDTVGPSRMTLLMEAARHPAASIDLLEELIQRGASLTRKDRERRWTPLEYAVWSGKMERVKFLVAAGSPLGDAEKVARAHGFFEIERYLQQEEIKEAALIQSALFSAAAAGDIDGVRGMVLAGANVMLRDGNGNSALDMAIRGESAEVVELLVQTMERDNGVVALPPLVGAARRGLVDVAAVLVEGGSPVDGEDSPRTQPPLISAIVHGHEEMVDFLLSAGANPNIRWRNATALRWAENEFRPGIAERLGTAGAVAEGAQLGSPLFNTSNRDRVVELLEAGADPDPPSASHVTLLTNVLALCRLEIAELLVAAGADVNRTPPIRNASPPLILALRNCGSIDRSRDLVELMLKKGADPNVQQNDGKSALAIASDRGRNDIVQLLLQYGATKERE